MAVERGAEIAPANGKLGVLLVGLGAVSRTNWKPHADGNDPAGKAHG